MSTARPALVAALREETGKKVAHLRHAGRLPAVVYGHGEPSTSVSVDAHDFDLLRRRVGANALIDLSIDGKKAKPVLIHDVQVHPVHRRPLHVDLFLVRMTEELIVDVPLVTVGTSVAVEMLSGTLMHSLESVRVKALPDKLPQTIEYSIDGLEDFDAVVRVSDLPIPSDVTLLTELGEVVARVLPPRVEIEVEEAPSIAEGAEAGEEATPESESSEATGSES